MLDIHCKKEKQNNPEHFQGTILSTFLQILFLLFFMRMINLKNNE